MMRTYLTALLAAALLCMAPATPAAATTATSDPSCSQPSLSSLLSGYGDPRWYFLAPGGDFETGAKGWTLTGGATLTSGSSPLGLGTARSSLRLPPNASATSPVFCVDLDYPTARYFGTQSAPWGGPTLTVDVIYPLLGRKTPQAAAMPGTYRPWTLARDVWLRPELVDRAGGWRYMQLRFRTSTAATGAWRVDDVLVDPRLRG